MNSILVIFLFYMWRNQMCRNLWDFVLWNQYRIPGDIYTWCHHPATHTAITLALGPGDTAHYLASLLFIDTSIRTPLGLVACFSSCRLCLLSAEGRTGSVDQPLQDRQVNCKVGSLPGRCWFGPCACRCFCPVCRPSDHTTGGEGCAPFPMCSHHYLACHTIGTPQGFHSPPPFGNSPVAY